MISSAVLPTEFIERLHVIAAADFDKVLNSYSGVKRPSIRINTLIIDEFQCVTRLKELGFELEQVVLFPVAYRVLNKSKRDLTDTDEYKKGWFYIQSLSSMLPVNILLKELEKSDRLNVLDMCAAPGSKTTQMAGVMKNLGHIVANDASKQRIYQLASNLKICGVKNTETLLYKGEFIWKKFGPVFDVVLLDAPCSGEGRFDLNDAKSYEDWSLNKVERLSQLQKQLIFSAVMCLKPGGTLLYSTCTMSPEENEEVIDFVLKKFEGAIDLEKIDLQEHTFADGRLDWNGSTFDERLVKTMRVLPNAVWDGFYVAKIHRAG
jgi:NOL1/NOP2/sun family putative RNA methylase